MHSASCDDILWTMVVFINLVLQNRLNLTASQLLFCIRQMITRNYFFC